MTAPTLLDAYLADWAGDEALKSATAKAVLAIAASGVEVAHRIARGSVEGAGSVVGENSDGDAQKALDVFANDSLTEHLRGAGVRVIASEEMDEPLDLGGGAPLVVAFDPLDGSSNIDTNAAIGAIFSILPARDDGGPQVLQPGRNQIAAGFLLYGPQMTLMLTLGQGTAAFLYDPDLGEFRLTDPKVTIPRDSREFAINASNQRHWPAAVRAYIQSHLDGASGPRGKDSNMRWCGSLVADCQRILVRGGVFLYPGDARKGYETGRLRLVYEANPIAFVVEQAGGMATDGRSRILDLTPTGVHQRIPLIFGSANEVESATSQAD